MSCIMPMTGAQETATIIWFQKTGTGILDYLLCDLAPNFSGDKSNMFYSGTNF